MIEAITKALFSGDSVTLIGFGTFFVSERAALNLINYGVL